MDIITLVVYIVILGLVFYLLYWLLGQIPMPQPFKVVATVLLGLAVVLILLSILFGGVTLPRINLR